MPTLTLAIPDKLKKEMESLPELNWSEIARKAISEKASEFKLFRKAVSKSRKLTLSELNKDFSDVSDVDTDEVIREMRERRYE